MATHSSILAWRSLGLAGYSPSELFLWKSGFTFRTSLYSPTSALFFPITSSGIFSYFIFLFICFWWYHMAFQILVPQPGVEPGHMAVKVWISNIGPPGNSLPSYFELGCSNIELQTFVSTHFCTNQYLCLQCPSPPRPLSAWHTPVEFFKPF